MGCPVHVDSSEGRMNVLAAINGIDASMQQVVERDMLSIMPISM